MDNIKFIRTFKVYTPFAETSYDKYEMFNNSKEVYNAHIYKFKRLDDYNTVHLYIQNRVTSTEEKIDTFTSSVFEFKVGDSVELEDSKVYEVEKVVRSVYGHITYYLSASYEKCQDYNELFEEAKKILDSHIKELEDLHSINDRLESPIPKGTWKEKIKNKLR